LPSVASEASLDLSKALLRVSYICFAASLGSDALNQSQQFDFIGLAWLTLNHSPVRPWT
jgi:hypothetical protein